MTEEKMIEISNLYHSYGDFEAVKGISFDVRKGEIFSFLGPNGAGKSTAINVLITLLKLQKGEVKIAGYDLTKEPSKVRESIGIVFQEITLDRDMTVEETLQFHGRLYSMPGGLRKQRTDELLELVELKDKRKALIKELSGGMKRRLEIARGLMTRPKVLFLDEPTIGLDPQTRMKMWEYLRAVNKQGTTIFLTTHYMDEADTLSDRIGIIDHGKIIAMGTPESLKNGLGEDVIYITTSDNEKAILSIKGFPGIKESKKKDREIFVIAKEDGTKLLPHLIHRLEEENIDVLSVNLKKPSMDDVFMHYTGRELRDEDASPQPFSPRRK
ncbi:ATP-binding cassette domain-containing protein [Methanoplanus sp. FWC-SCC4]|uniref:ATP-binding cassette domain-containing protein n=1 Tax=Methanochimaera problematica TaxID=2609417 RepID=A0AA97FEW3_9EURY|nr:ATP-binding cassette domain-containing protein [Methanoplanus sp. FWC-SCC4]WOF17013.1 ATP-binding cassette domain-containing protein [Methanoplanus sp. FWC-SCC4]